jgi:hypothetical protein
MISNEGHKMRGKSVEMEAFEGDQSPNQGSIPLKTRQSRNRLCVTAELPRGADVGICRDDGQWKRSVRIMLVHLRSFCFSRTPYTVVARVCPPWHCLNSVTLPVLSRSGNPPSGEAAWLPGMASTVAAEAEDVSMRKTLPGSLRFCRRRSEHISGTIVR